MDERFNPLRVGHPDDDINRYPVAAHAAMGTFRLVHHPLGPR